MSVLQDFFSPKHLAKDQRRTYRLWLIGGSVCLVVSLALVIYVIEVGVRAPSPRSYLRRNVSSRIAPLFAAQINAAKASMPRVAPKTAVKALKQPAATTTKAIQQNAHQ